MEKYFKLPKEFTEKWLTALRSGEYEQGRENLVTSYENGNTSYCCLGVACSIAMNNSKDDDLLGGASFISEDYLDDEILERLEENFFPDELFGENRLTLLLAGLNDGTSLFSAKSGVPRFKFPKDKIKDKKIKYSFEEIADLIEQIVETY